ncbi:hypothetical protein KIH27_20075 [Mycobacterium sp. M1]|uniref:PD-(D/E)XK nuclease superfamily protein n=1 Tax=Mycolicibacter acidiphilus TaxID=2835306 RepID=A0ABS5RNU2_9MYCO|nr:hypothetical protein [Mycolicibacter acidiphilus]MBS9535886.1 hypothetical protein [Mycolicibacter acidiphilus]
MAELKRHGTDVTSVFDLVGRDENDLTAALAFALSRSPVMAKTLLQRVWPEAGKASWGKMALALEVRDQDGRTDLEIRLPDALLIIEAKRGWGLPEKAQLRRYARRITKGPGAGVLITLSQASPELAAMKLPSDIDGVAVRHLAWGDVLADISSARHGKRGQERLWLEEFRAYLQEVVRVRRIEDSWTYCVAINNEMPADGGKYTFLEYITKAKCYFHPFGTNGWTTEPPNFLAFRWSGAVQRIYRVKHAEVVPSLLQRWPKLKKSPRTERPHVVYDLGAQLPPFEPIPNGAPYRANRLWVLLDQLQTADTLKAAHDATRALRDA